MSGISITTTFRVAMNDSGKKMFPLGGSANSEVGLLLCVVA